MGGAAASSGATYQTRVVAFVYVHILAQMRLGWLSLADDTPLAVSGKTGGPGDDPRSNSVNVTPPSRSKQNAA